MARSMWSESISFGLVNVPVRLYPAVSSKDVRFHQLEEGTGARIRQKRVSAETGEEVPYERIVKAYEISPDRYVMITPEDLDALDPTATAPAARAGRHRPQPVRLRLPPLRAPGARRRPRRPQRSRGACRRATIPGWSRGRGGR
jgi:Ku70/Ku80-like protein